jgi:hypothetical protein
MKLRVAALLGCSLSLFGPAAAHAAGGRVQAGAAVVDGTYHVGSSAGQYASTRDGGYGDVDPHAQSVKNQASYGVQSRETVRALVVKGADGKLVAMVTDDHYIPQDAMWRRTAQLLDADTGGLIGKANLTMAVAHNHSSPSYSSLDWGVWTFQDAFDFRFFDYYAHQNAAAVEKALKDLHDVRVSATVSHFDAFQRNPMGPGVADDGTPDGFPRSDTDHDLSVVRFENVDDRRHPKPLATLVNIGQHPEDLEGYDLISGEYPQEMERFVDRTVGGVTLFTQNATGTSEVERDNWHSVHDRELFDHAQYGQMEWAARQLADGVIADVRDIDRQRPNPDDTPPPYGGTSYHDRFIRWMTDFPVAMEDRWYGGPVSHPAPGVSSCRTDPTLGGNPRLPLVGLPDCEDVPAGSAASPVTSQTGSAFPGLNTDDFEQLGVPFPENLSVPSTGALEDTAGVHMQAFRLGDILFTVCSCEQWVEQSYNIKTRTDTKPGNEWLGYDATSPAADPSLRCVKNGDGTYKDDGTGSGTWTCNPGGKLGDRLVEHMRAQVLNDASGWDDPSCMELGCGLQAESEPTDLTKIRGSFTHDDTTVRGGKDQTQDYASKYGYKMTVTVAMANDYNGYIASYREFMDHDHYRKALTGWGPHSADYYATRLSAMGHALKGDGAAQNQVDADPLAAKEVADQSAEDAKVRAVGDAASAGVQAYAQTLPDDGGTDAELVQPKDIRRFDSATFTWDGGNNYSDNPTVTVERQVRGKWVAFADQTGEIPVTLKYPSSDPSGVATYHAGGQVWKWTATFEAFVSRFPLVDPQGHAYTATPAGTYRFVVHGKWRKGNADAPYTRVSNPFTVAPWDGITVEDAKTGDDGRVSFTAGPSHRIAEKRVRNTDRPPLAANDAPVTFDVGPVDFPDTARDQKATGARFLTNVRGYSGTSMTDVEQYCLDCSFRPWLDATGRLVAHVTIGGRTETLHPDGDGRFVSHRTLAAGQTAKIAVEDAWGDTTAAPATVTR